MKCKILQEMKCRPCAEFPQGIKPEGTVIDHPDAYRLVQLGAAEAVDDECRREADITPQAWERARYAWIRANKGIHPEDFAAYDAGLMDGYDADGDPIPGPNAVEPEYEGPIEMP